MTQIIEITSRLDNKTHKTEFEPVRSVRGLTLGWATLLGDVPLRFPAILLKTSAKRGYTVYTVADWQAPPGSFGDLSDPLDWALLCHTGTGKFTNPRLKFAQPLNVSALALPLDDEQTAAFKRTLS